MRACKVDRNQVEVVHALRAAGVSVQHLHKVGHGCPDILCGYRGVNTLLEIKDGSKPPSGRGLTKDQIRWHTDWRGFAQIVTSIDEAFVAVGMRNAGGEGV